MVAICVGATAQRLLLLAPAREAAHPARKRAQATLQEERASGDPFLTYTGGGGSLILPSSDPPIAIPDVDELPPPLCPPSPPPPAASYNSNV